MKIFALCKPYLLSQKHTLIAYIALTLAATSIAIITPYIIGEFLDSLIAGADVSVIIHFCAVFGGLSVIRIIKGYIAAILYTKMQAKMSYELGIDTIKHIQSLSLSYMNNKDSAYINQRISSDAVDLIVFCIRFLQNIVTNAIMLAVPFAILLTMNWFVALLMVSFIALYVTIYIFFRKPIYMAGLAFREAQAKLFARLFDQLKYIKLIKTNAIQKEMNSRADKCFLKLRSAAIHNQKVNYLYSGMDGFISTLAQISLFVVGGIQILLGNFTIGMFTIFSSYFSMMLTSSRYFSGLGAAFQNTLVSYNRLKDILEQEPESCGTINIKHIEKIQITNIDFSYADSSNRAINSVTANFAKGKMYAISGANGAGKSTLINLMMGLYIDEYSGHITYNDVDIRQIEMIDARRRLLGYAEQEPTLISESIRFNLDFGVNGALDDDEKEQGLASCIAMLGMQDFISENTLDFMFNESNTNISGGEKQKVSILKVLFKNPDVMIFDEPTSALDASTTQRFVEYLRKIKQDKIIVLITHDESIKGSCDEVLEVGV